MCLVKHGEYVPVGFIPFYKGDICHISYQNIFLDSPLGALKDKIFFVLKEINHSHFVSSVFV